MTRFVAVASLAASLLLSGRVGLAQPAAGRYYQIKNVNSGKLLSVQADSAKAGAKIVQMGAKEAKGKGDETQQWKLVQVEDHYKIVNRMSGKVLEVPDTSKDEFVQVQQGIDRRARKNQLWLIERFSGRSYTIKSNSARFGGLVLDVLASDKSDGARVIVWPLNVKGERKNQRWEFVPVR